MALSWLHAPVTVLSVDYNNPQPVSDGSVAIKPLTEILSPHHPEYENVYGEEAIETIVDFAFHNNISLILGMGNISEEIIHHARTQQIIYQSMVPVLSVHE